jgi:methionine-rich copper-binding protein CopC
VKKILILALALLWLLPASALAHSTLEEASPAQNETVTVSPETVSLTFNTKIEKLSNFKLLDENRQEITPDHVTVDGSTMSGTIAEPLPNGNYTVKWTIIGADGHAVEGNYSFTVEAAAATEEPSPTAEEPSAAPEEEASPSPAPEAATDNGTDAAEDDQPLQEQESTNYTPAIIIGAIIVVAALILFLRRRKP